MQQPGTQGHGHLGTVGAAVQDKVLGKAQPVQENVVKEGEGPKGQGIEGDHRLHQLILGDLLHDHGNIRSFLRQERGDQVRHTIGQRCQGEYHQGGIAADDDHSHRHQALGKSQLQKGQKPGKTAFQIFGPHSFSADPFQGAQQKACAPYGGQQGDRQVHHGKGRGCHGLDSHGGKTAKVCQYMIGHIVNDQQEQ